MLGVVRWCSSCAEMLFVINNRGVVPRAVRSVCTLTFSSTIPSSVHFAQVQTSDPLLSLSCHFFNGFSLCQNKGKHLHFSRWRDEICVLAEHFEGVALIISVSSWWFQPGWCSRCVSKHCLCWVLVRKRCRFQPSAEGLLPENVSPCRRFQGCIPALDRGASCQCAAAGAAPCSLPVPRTGCGLFPGCSPHPARPLVSTAGPSSEQRRFAGSRPHPGLV